VNSQNLSHNGIIHERVALHNKMELQIGAAAIGG